MKDRCLIWDECIVYCKSIWDKKNVESHNGEQIGVVIIWSRGCPCD